MSEFTTEAGQPLEANDPDVLAFRALQGADKVAIPGSLQHYEVALRGVAEIAPTPKDAKEIAKVILEHEKTTRLAKEFPVIVNLLERSRSITPEEAKALREGTAGPELETRVHRTALSLEIRQGIKARKTSR